jgi:hypothetical protein
MQIESFKALSEGGDTLECLPIKIDNQIGLTGRTAAHRLDRRSSSEAQGRTRKTVWTTRTAQRSRWRRFESCRGREKFLNGTGVKAVQQDRHVPSPPLPFPWFPLRVVHGDLPPDDGA